MTDRYIQCRFCSWETRIWRKTKKGETRGPSTAFYLLADHILDEHPEEAAKIEAELAKGAADV